MAVAMYFHPASMSVTQYDECIRQLEEAGQGEPEGRLYHASFGEGGQIQVFDVWESREAFERFGQTLMPILQRLGIDPGTPHSSTIHRIIKG